MKLSDSLRDVGQPVPYYPKIAKAVGGVKSAIFLCRFAWWDGQQADKEGWIYKSQEEIYNETGMSEDEQLSARKKLKSMGVLEERYDRLQHRMNYRINFDNLDVIWDTFHVGQTPTNETIPQLPESGKVGLGKPETSDSTNPGKSDSTYSTKDTHSTRTKYKEVAYELPLTLNTPLFKEAWERWIKFRKELRKPLTSSTINAQLRTLESAGESDSVSAINRSIEMGWQGLFLNDRGQERKADHSKGFNG